MPTMIWSQEMSVGVVVLDEDHKKLIAMINELHEAMLHGRSKEVFADILCRLSAYTVEHFTREEGFLSETGYPSLDLHHRVHEKLKADVAAIRRKFDKGVDAALQIDTLQFLQDWLQNHILQTDKRYVAHLNAHDIR